MRRAPLVTLCAVTALAMGALVPAATAQSSARAQSSGPAQSEGPGSTATGSTAAGPAVAQRTLASVESAFAYDAPAQARSRQVDRGRDLTLLLRDLRVQLPSLRGEDRARAVSYLARPTDGAADVYGDGYAVRDQDDCGVGEPGEKSDFCIHWVRSTDDAPSLADSNGKRDGDGIPDQVEETRATMRHVWKQEIDVAGYKAPLRDAGPPKAGPNKRFDVYLSNIGGQGLYGYCAGEPTPGDGNDAAAFCVLDDDYSHYEFPSNTPLENLQVTAAHEFFHAIQFAYDAREDTWFMEGTATWMEDEVYDAVDDNRFYLRFSPLTKPGRSLDRGTDLYVYGSWLWWRWLSEQHSADRGTGIPKIIRKIWEAADDSDPSHPGTYSLKATSKALHAVGSNLTREYAAFGVANRQPAAAYEEGDFYRPARLAVTTGLSVTARSRPWTFTRLNHLATRTYGYTPGNGLATGNWRLRLRVDGPGRKHSPAASVTSFLTAGGTETERIPLDTDGDGVVEVPFDSDLVQRVELTLTNAGHAFTCDQGTTLSCRGTSKDDNRRFGYRAKLTR